MKGYRLQNHFYPHILYVCVYTCAGKVVTWQQANVVEKTKETSALLTGGEIHVFSQKEQVFPGDL